MSEDKYKVVTKPGGNLVKKKASEDKGPDGLTREQADADAQRRNASAEGLGITTRYEVVPL